MSNRTIGIVFLVWSLIASLIGSTITRYLENERLNGSVSVYEHNTAQYKQEITTLEGKVGQYRNLKYLLYEDSNHLIGNVLQFDSFSVVYIVQTNQNQQGQYNVYGIEQGVLRMQDTRTSHMLEFYATQGNTVHILENPKPDEVMYYVCGTFSDNCTTQVKTARVLP